MRSLTVVQRLVGRAPAADLVLMSACDRTPAAVGTIVSLAMLLTAWVVYASGPCRKQVRGSLKFILGIPTISSTLGLAVAQQLLGRTTSSWLPDTASAALLQLLLLAVLADFGLYWGEHRSRQAGMVKQLLTSRNHGMHL
jgi:hypothetical protein